MALQIITPPSAEPIHLIDALTHIKYDAGIDDARVKAAITAARSSAETKTWRQLVAARHRQVFDYFPCKILLDRTPVLEVESITYIAMDGTTKTVDASTYTADCTGDPCRISPVFGATWPIPMPQIGSVAVTFKSGFAAPISVDIAANTINVKIWKTQVVGDAVRFSNSGGALPAPLLPDTDYFITSAVSGAYQISDSLGGAPIVLTTISSGTSFIGEIPGDILAWMKLRIGSLDQYRSESIAMDRGSIEALSFTDSLLDGYPTW